MIVGHPGGGGGVINSAGGARVRVGKLVRETRGIPSASVDTDR